MKTKKIQILTVILSSIFYAFLFWQQKLGLNIFIFSVYILAITFFNKTIKKSNTKTYITASAVLLSSIFVVINHSIASFITYFFSLAIFLGFTFNHQIKTTYTAILAGFMKSISTQFQAFENLFFNLKTGKISRPLKILKIGILPFIVLIIFHFIFVAANPIYQEYSSNFFVKIGEFIENIFSKVFISQLGTFFLGLLIMNIFIYSGNNKYFKNSEQNKLDNIKRTRSKKRYFKFLGLKTENYIAVTLVIMVNLLLLIVNFIDINWIWLNKINNNPATLSELVHKGTYLLIFSIFLSMAIMLYFFRKNQNFYSKNKLLKITSYVWIFQNFILLLSVALRNYHYISNAGLAYKRIGVIFFLILTIIGLFLMFQKIKNKKTMFYLMKTNSWSVFLILILIAAFNWDVIIAKYNLSNNVKSGIDRVFLYKLSDKALYVIDQNNQIILNSKNRRI